jgi:predicted acylesterase/phospholipase RssA
VSASCKVWQACRATSAANTYFDVISLGPFKQSFLDGGIRHNNPVNMALEEAQSVWPDRDILLVSIGTGVPPELPIDGNLANIAEQMKNIATDTQQTHRTFYESHRSTMVDQNRYFRFNVPGAGGIGLAEWRAMPTLAGNTQSYLSDGETADKLEKCVNELSKAQSEGTH